MHRRRLLRKFNEMCSFRLNRASQHVKASDTIRQRERPGRHETFIIKLTNQSNPVHLFIDWRRLLLIWLMILKPLRMEIECDTLKLDLIEGHYRPRGGSELIAHLRLVLFHNLNMIMTRRLLLIVGLTVVAFLMVVAFSLLLVLQGLVYFNISACLFLFFSFFFFCLLLVLVWVLVLVLVSVSVELSIGAVSQLVHPSLIQNVNRCSLKSGVARSFSSAVSLFPSRSFSLVVAFRYQFHQKMNRLNPIFFNLNFFFFCHCVNSQQNCKLSLGVI